MSAVPPSSHEQPRLGAGHAEEGKPAALVVWGLYILSIPSANVLVLVGLVIAYAARGSATGLSRQHMDAQISLFWSVFWWTIATWVGIAISIPLMVVGIGFLTIILFGILWFLLSIWFTVKSVFGLLNLLGDKPA